MFSNNWIWKYCFMKIENVTMTRFICCLPTKEMHANDVWLLEWSPMAFTWSFGAFHASKAKRQKKLETNCSQTKLKEKPVAQLQVAKWLVALQSTTSVLVFTFSIGPICQRNQAHNIACWQTLVGKCCLDGLCFHKASLFQLQPFGWTCGFIIALKSKMFHQCEHFIVNLTMEQHFTSIQRISKKDVVTFASSACWLQISYTASVKFIESQMLLQ